MSASRTITILLAALLLATFGLTPPAPALAKKSTPLPPAGLENKPGKKTKEKTIILGLATLHDSVFGGTMEIYNTNGKRVTQFNPQVHPKGGYFELPMPEGHLKRLKKTNNDHDLSTNGLAFRLVLRDGVTQDLPGTRVTLMADVTGFDPATQIIYLNPVTTLIALYRDAKPGLTLAEAEANVRDYFAFPAHLSVGLHVTTGVDYFDRQRLLQEARAHRGGLTGFLESVVPEIGTGLVNSFAKPLAASPSQDHLVCVNTFAFEEGADPTTAIPFVQVGGDRYPRPTAGDAIQVVTLKRDDLTLVSNKFFPPVKQGGLPGVANFIATLSSANIVIISGGQFLGDPISLSFIDDLAKDLAGIGAASFKMPDARDPNNPPFTPRTWSIIGIPGNKYGDAYQKSWVDQRFPLQDTIMATNCSEPLTTDNRGNLSGYFTADSTGENFTFTPTEFPTFDTNFSQSQPNADPRSNTMVIAGNQPVTATLPDGFVGGFHRVQVDGRTGQVVVNAMIGTHKNVNGQVVEDPDGFFEFAWLEGQPQQGTVGDTIVLMTSVGTTPIETVTPAPGTGDVRGFWGIGTQIYAQDYGASFHILNTLSASDQYSMAGVGSPDPQLPFTYAVESSLQITPNAPVGRVSGFFKRSRQGYFVPMMGSSAELSDYNPDGSPQALNILEIAYQPPSNWPFSDTSEEQQALKEFSDALDLGTNSPREDYGGLSVDWGNMQENVDQFLVIIPAGDFPGLGTLYTQTDWDNVQGTLSLEMGWLSRVNTYLNSVQQFLDNSGAANQANLKSVGDAVEGKVNASGSNKTNAFLGELFSVTGSVFIAAVSVSNPEIAVGLTAVMGAYGLAQQLGADAGGNSADAFESQVSQLSTTVQTQTQTAVESIKSIRVLLSTDYGKLSESGPLVLDAWQGKDVANPAWTTTLEQASTQNFYGSLMNQRWIAYTLEDPKVTPEYTGPGQKVCKFDCDIFGDCTKIKPWAKGSGVAPSGRFNFVWGYDTGGNPLTQLWFWGRGYNSGTGDATPVNKGLTDPMWEEAGVVDGQGSVGVGLVPPQFWWQKNPARRFHCNGSKPFDSRTTGEGQ